MQCGDGRSAWSDVIICSTTGAKILVVIFASPTADGKLFQTVGAERQKARVCGAVSIGYNLMIVKNEQVDIG